MDVPIAHSLRHVRRQHRTIPAAAIHNELSIRIGKHFLDVALDNPFAQMHRARGVTLLPFAVFAHIEQDSLWVSFQTLSRLLNGNFLYLRSGLVDDLQETWRMIHERTIRRSTDWSNGFAAGKVAIGDCQALHHPFLAVIS